jgi:hypothetical protein
MIRRLLQPNDFTLNGGDRTRPCGARLGEQRVHCSIIMLRGMME